MGGWVVRTQRFWLPDDVESDDPGYSPQQLVAPPKSGRTMPKIKCWVSFLGGSPARNAGDQGRIKHDDHRQVRASAYFRILLMRRLFGRGAASKRATNPRCALGLTATVERSSRCPAAATTGASKMKSLRFSPPSSAARSAQFPQLRLDCVLALQRVCKGGSSRNWIPEQNPIFRLTIVEMKGARTFEKLSVIFTTRRPQTPV